MSRYIIGLSCALASFLVGCGGATGEPEHAPANDTATATSGSEVERSESDPVEVAPVQVETPAPVVLRTTIPVPVPQPAVAREQLSAPLQTVWTYIEEQVSIERPAGPDDTTVVNVQAWADGPFTEWINARRDALVETRALLEAISQEPVHERALALALWAYAFEDLGAQIGGAPVPAEIATDDELRGIYIESLNAASVPLGQRAMELYADCQQRLVTLGDDSAWLPWRAYCVQRGQELIEGYGLDDDASD